MDLSFFILSSEEQIAKKFGYSYKELSSLIYPNTNKSYGTFEILKKNGETRIINAPKIKLLKIQKAFAEELTKIYPPRKCAHGFLKGRSIVTNAQKHTNKRYVFNVDLKDFFKSIHFGRVRNLFMSKPFNYPHNQATILAQICCHNGALPQGAATSPIISNMICLKLDAQLQRLAIENRCTYTRYADDITFSFDVSKAKLPRSILRINTTTDEITVSPLLENIIKENGFHVNSEKIRLQGRSQRQAVTGLTVNNGVNLKRSYIRQTYSMLHAWRKYGAIAAEQEYLQKYRLKNIQFWQNVSVEKADGEFFIKVVKGRINFIQMVKGRNNPVYRKLAYQLTEALGKPNTSFKKSQEQLATFIIQNLFKQETGTGFLLENVGIVTNAHTVDGMNHSNGELYNIFRCDEEHDKKKCEYISSSTAHDIAILNPHDDFKKITPYKRGNDKNIKIGTHVTVVGFPGYHENTGASVFICKGSVTSQRKLFGIQAWLVDIPINHGCSGGPVLNEQQEVIGIATFGAEHNDGSTEVNGFIPISFLDEVLEKKNQADKA